MADKTKVQGLDIGADNRKVLPRVTLANAPSGPLFQ